MDLTDL